jgi:PAS domain S-box-containing protein
MDASDQRGLRRDFARFLRENAGDILAEWEDLVRRLPSAASLDQPEIRDQVPELIARIADNAEAPDTVARPEPSRQASEQHALDRLARGFRLGEVVLEYSLLRDCMLRRWVNTSQRRGLDTSSGALLVDRTIDRAIAAAVDRYVEQREQAIHALRERAERNEERLRLALDATAQGTWDWDLDRDVLDWDERCNAILGLPPASRMSFERFIEQVHEGDRARVEQAIQRALDPSGGGVYDIQYRTVRLPGSPERWVAARGKCLFEGGRPRRMLGTALDITEPKQNEADQQFLLDASRAVAGSIDYEKTLATVAQLAVPAFADWCGVEIRRGGDSALLQVAHTNPAKVALVRELRRRYPPDPDSPVGVPHVIRTGQPELYQHISDEMLVQAAQSPEHLALLRGLGLRSLMILPLIGRNQVLGAVTFGSAESGRRYTQHDLLLAEDLARRAAAAIDNALLFSQAEAAVRSREEVLAIVSHDLRNPLGVIGMSAQLLGDRLAALEQSAPLCKLVDTIGRSVTRMVHLITDLLDTASIQGGRLSIERSQQAAESIVREVLDTHEPMAIDKGLALERRCRPGDLAISCDRERVLQVFANLLGNAIKFCQPGQRIAIDCERAGTALRFAVSDTGPGIANEDLARIFEPYWSARQHAAKGTGLGLYISRGIVEAHGGRMWAESHVGAGSTFYFTLPVAD